MILQAIVGLQCVCLLCTSFIAQDQALSGLMEIFEERYFSFNRKLFVYMGLWPFGPRTRNVRKYLLVYILFLITVPHVISVTVNYSNVDRLMLNLVIFFAGFLMFTKVLSLIAAEKKMKALYRNIADNWLAVTDGKEKEILIEYSELARKKAILYFVFVQIGTGSLFVLPTIPKILDVVSPQSSARQNIYILEGELLVDRDTYYWWYYFGDVVSIIMTSTVSVTIDTMYIICVEHCCALYAIIRYRLRNLKPIVINDSTENVIDSYNYIIGIINLHRNTLNFTKTINRAFSTLFLFILIANMGAIPLVAVTVISNLDEPYNCVRFGMLFILFFVHLFMLFWPGQNVLDHGTEFIMDAYYNEWYTTSLRTKRIDIMFMIRCTRPALLSAGGLMLMNYETFAVIVRTAISYIAVAASFR